MVSKNMTYQVHPKAIYCKQKRMKQKLMKKSILLTGYWNVFIHDERLKDRYSKCYIRALKNDDIIDYEGVPIS